MTEDIGALLRRIFRAVRSGDLGGATQMIQDALKPSRPARQQTADITRMRWPLGDTVRTLREGRAGFEPPSRLSDFHPPLGPSLHGLAEPPVEPLSGLPLPGRPDQNAPGTEPAPTAPLEPPRFLERMMVTPAGSRRVRLYVPSRPAGQAPAGLVLMLHGCGQTPEDFATGTQMNSVAETHGMMVVYPEQTRAENAKNCWNWFRPGDQGSGAGEPAILASLVQQIVGEFDVPVRRIFVAGLSAGGGMAAILAAAYPELFCAVGVHSGVPNGAANDALSALAVMRGDVGPGPRPKPGRTPFIVFHGSADRTVNAINADRVLAAAPRPAEVVTERGEMAGREVERTIATLPDGGPASERWIVKGTGHAWSGGGAKGSYTDPAGPDASVEMIRFFLGVATHAERPVAATAPVPERAARRPLPIAARQASSVSRA